MTSSVQNTALPPNSIDRARPDPAALPTEKHRVMKKTPQPASTPTGFPSVCLIVPIMDRGEAIPTRTLISVKKIISTVETRITQIRA